MKKSTVFIIALCVSCVIAGCAKETSLPKLMADAMPQSGGNASFESLVLDEQVQVAKDLHEVMIYDCSPVNISQEQISELTQFMGFTVAKNEDMDGYTISADGQGNSVIVYKDSGAVSCNFEILDQTDEFKGELLSEDEYKSIALKWIRDAGLFTDEFSESASIYENGFIETTKDGKEYTYPTEMTVVYYHKPLDGIEVGGVAPRIVVSLNMEGDVMSVQKIQRAFTATEKYPIKTVQQAVEDVLAGKGTVYGQESTKLNGTVTEVDIVYYNQDAMTAQQTLLPVYVLTGTCENGEFTAVVYAVEDKYLNETEIE